jgi:hypothetical protein
MTKTEKKKEAILGLAQAWKVKEQQIKMGWDKITKRQQVVGSFVFHEK